ncbi:DUF433 domain-containing protein [Sphingomonas sp. 10B4]|uniref:DUF433 domain-containing protein n=1 Tax=Sphingomonas sp. 10B4 TaxID=3048575 RepID=UPI002AB3F5BD|nr:DUF433 domain-containing protein [Sphingomonas sp. 10B4]MDY7525859.1 DUF433 domain-containing protein [Sphingomonas sp. 10B4]MEB0284401.1 DUF433 domain-containing protein [Sphingomonas sp. 10B4]
MNASVRPADFWRARLDTPNYEVNEAARYAGVHSSTVSRWQRNTTLGARDSRIKLSYLQLIELAVAASCKEAGMKLADIRAARAYFAGAFNTAHPFATLKLQTDGIDLALQAGADLLIGNRNGQLAWKGIIGDRFKQFEYEDGLATRWHVAGKRSPVVIDPRVRFGAPHVAGVPTWLLKERWQSGEPIAEIKDDLSLDTKDVNAALRFEGIDPSKPRKGAWLN